ncbi:unnamed protein product [Amaranthus hypochondriacus]
MADSLVERCSKLTIVNEEEDVVEIGDSLDESHDEKLSLRLIGRVLTEKPLNFDAFKRMMLHVWCLKDGVVIRAMGSNTFMFQFFHWRDMEKVLNGRPWSFEQRLLVLQEINKDLQPSDIVLNTSPFWVRFYNLPYGCRSDSVLRSIAKAIGEVMEIEDDFLDLNPFRRVRILINVDKPLKRFQNVRLKGESTVKISLKYERLPHFCFLCGLMNHTEKNYTVVDEEDKERGYNWGLDIKASPRKGYHKINEEIERLKVRKNLFVSKPKGGGDTLRRKEGLIPDTGNIPLTFVDDGIGVPVKKNPQLTLVSDTDEGHLTVVAANVKGGSGDTMGLDENALDMASGKKVVVNVGNNVHADDVDNNHDDVPNVVSVGDLNNSQCDAPVSVPNNVLNAPLDADSGSVPFAFNAGSSLSSSRSFFKAKRKSGPRPLSKNKTKQVAGVEENNVHNVDTHTKRKTWDTDTEMLDCDGDMKRSCSGYGIFFSSDIQVAEVGVDQLREQQ